MIRVLTNNNDEVVGIDLVFYSEPVAQGRPRFSTRGKFVKAYDPKKSSDYKEKLALVAQEVYKERKDFVPFENQPLALNVIVYRSIPKSFPKKKRERALVGSLRPITKPDTDNYLKGVKDACNGILWKDDAIIVTETCHKFYSDRPRIELCVWTMG